jgi:Predicted integral membrane sensor domain
VVPITWLRPRIAARVDRAERNPAVATDGHRGRGVPHLRVAVWPGVALAALAVNLPISTNGLAAAATAAGNTLAPVVAALLLVRVGFRREIDRLQDALAIVFLAALLSMLISASIGTARWCFPEPYRQQVPGRWAVWWTGDAMGVLVVAPFLLVLLQRPWSGSLRERTELGALLLLVATVPSS